MAASPLQAQITQLGEQMNRGFEKLEKRIDAFEARVRDVEHREAGCQPLFAQQIQGLGEGQKKHHERIAELEKIVNELKQSNKIIAWVGSLAGTAVIGWVIYQLLGLIK